jgi:putative membrane protein
MNQKEIQLAKLAEDRAGSQQVKSVASDILRDHQNLEDQVRALADAEGIKLSDFQPSTSEKVAVDRLKGLKGKQFDQVFLKTMHVAHKEAAEELKIARGEVKDRQIIALIDQAIPQVNEHSQTTAVIQQNVLEEAQAGEAGEV